MSMAWRCKSLNYFFIKCMVTNMVFIFFSWIIVDQVVDYLPPRINVSSKCYSNSNTIKFIILGVYDYTHRGQHFFEILPPHSLNSVECGLWWMIRQGMCPRSLFGWVSKIYILKFTIFICFYFYIPSWNAESLIQQFVKHSTTAYI